MKDPAPSKVVERRLNWYGHTEMRDGTGLLQKVKDCEVAGKWKRGRPKGIGAAV